MDPFDRIHGIDDFQDGQLGRSSDQRETAMNTALRGQNARLGKPLKNLDQITRRSTGAFRNVPDFLGFPRLLRQPNHRLQGIFRGIRKQFHTEILVACVDEIVNGRYKFVKCALKR